KDSSDKSSAPLDNPAQNDASQNSNNDSTLEDATESDSNTSNTDTDSGVIDNSNEDEEMDEPNDQAITEKNVSQTTANLKEEYLQKVNNAKKEVEKMRENPIDDTTFALKKVEGDTYDLLDGLLNEIY